MNILEVGFFKNLMVGLLLAFLEAIFGSQDVDPPLAIQNVVMSVVDNFDTMKDPY